MQPLTAILWRHFLGAVTVAVVMCLAAPVGLTPALAEVPAPEVSAADDGPEPEGRDGEPSDDDDNEQLSPEEIRAVIRSAIVALDAAAGNVDRLERRRAAISADLAVRNAQLESLTAVDAAEAAAAVERSAGLLAELNGRHDAAAVARDELEVRARAVALGLYLAGPIDHLDFGVVTNHPEALGRLWSTETVRYGVAAAHEALRRQEARITRIKGAIERRQAILAADHLRVSEVDAVIGEQQGHITRLEQRLHVVNTELADRMNDVNEAQENVVFLLAAADISWHRAADPSLTVLGPSMLEPAELAAWFADYGGNGNVDPRLVRLAGLFVSEGRKLGVRGDVAFVQAVLETGGFRFTGSHNYAGVGHCDDCPRGFSFASEREGVRAQLQLLRAYADVSVTPDDLPGGPVVPIDVAALGVRGCCVSWWGLTGVWATALHYGGSIHQLYELAVRHATEARQAA